MKKTKVYLKDIVNEHPDKGYMELYDYITQLIEKGEIKPIKNAGLNGKKPALPIAYWHFEDEIDYSQVIEELNYRIHPLINTEYYRTHPERYADDEHNLKLLSNYLKDNSHLLGVSETKNERSFEIFRREKFFQEEGGLQFCKRVGIDPEKLNFYETSEPLSYYSYSKQSPQNILIIENKDTFYDIRKYMEINGNVVLNKEFDTLIYGGGKRIWKTFYDYANGAEAYFNSNNNLLYFGDIDYEGILIYEHLVEMNWINVHGNAIKIEPFLSAYEAMLDKAESIGVEGLPHTKEKQNDNIDNVFLEYFGPGRRKQILDILQAGKYVPQEILNEHDWG